MAKKGVSSKTHTKAQLNDYANQHNPNNKAYEANNANKKKMKKKSKNYDNPTAELDWMCYGNPFDFE